VISKVIVYIIRFGNAFPELLVFEHIDVEAGIQVPKGTVEHDETLEHAAKRELFEETGLHANNTLRFIGTLERFGERWHFFTMTSDVRVPNEWQHKVGGVGEDNGMRFRFFWLPLTLALELAGKQNDGLPFLDFDLMGEI